MLEDDEPSSLVTVGDLEVYSQSVQLSYPAHYGLKKTQVVLNFTDTPISVQYRDGIVFEMPPQIQQSDYSRPGVLVRVTYEMGAKVQVDGGSINAPTKEQYPDRTAIQHSVMHARTNRDRSVTFEVDYFIDSLRIRRHGGTLYLEQLDLLISTPNGNGMPSHPQSRLGRHMSARDSGNKDYAKGDFYYRLRFIDNDEIYSTHYVNINGVVYSVKPVKDLEFQNGIHHYAPQWSLGDCPNDELVHCDYATIEEGIKKYGLYPTKDEAIAHGNQKDAFESDIRQQKQQIQERELEIAKEKMEMSKTMFDLKSQQEKEMTLLKNRHEQENELREERLLSLREERDMFKSRLEHDQYVRKDYYDNRVHLRKDTSEIIKFVPVILTAVAGVVGVMVGGKMK